MEKYDITKPIKISVGMHKLNNDPSISFQLNRLVNMDGCDLAAAKEIGNTIRSAADFYTVLKKRGDFELENGHIKNAAALYRMSEFFTDWEDPNGLAAWKKARELFFEYYADFFDGEHPLVELVNVPYENYTMPALKFNADKPKGDIVMHGGFDSSYEEFFAECEYLREQGYNVYLFEGPGQGECIRLHGAPLIIEWEKPVMAVTKYFDLHNAILIGQSLGGFYAPRASAFDDRITKCVSIAQFGALKMNFHNNAFVNGLVWGLLNVILFLFGWLINIIYAAKKGKGMAFFRTYFHRFGTTNVYKLIQYLHAIDLRPVADKLTKDYLIIGGSKDTMACRAGIGRQMLILKNARSVTAREITEREFGADHCCCGNQLAAMDAVLLWAELMERRDKSLDEKNN
ncbi:alpha/beta hydrolase [Huintestinicola sp.]